MAGPSAPTSGQKVFPMLKNEARRSSPVCVPRNAADSSVLGLAELGLLVHILATPEGVDLTEQSLAETVGVDQQELAPLLASIERAGLIGFGCEPPTPPARPSAMAAATSQPCPIGSAASRRVRLKVASPPWLSADQLAAMADVRRQARRASEETGVPHEVDHIVPLRGATVCGLNVPWNLRVIPGRINNFKSNRLDEELSLGWSHVNEHTTNAGGAHA